MKKICENFSLRTIIFLSLFTIGVTPLVLFISVNLPTVLNKLETNAEKENISKLFHLSQKTQNIIERRKKSLRVISLIPGVRDMAGIQTDDSIPVSLRRKRINLLLTSWFNDETDVVGLTILDNEGREQLRIKRNDAGVLALMLPEELTNQKESSVFKESSSVEPGSVFVGEIVSKTSSQQIKHNHSIKIYLGIPIVSNKKNTRGVAFLDIDLMSLLSESDIKNLILGDGTYIYCPYHPDHHSASTHSHIGNTAFDDFQELKQAMVKNTSCIVTDQQDEKFAWAPILKDQHPDHSLWAGHIVDTKEVERWMWDFLYKFVAIFLLLICLIFLSAIKISAKAARFRQNLTDGLQQLLNTEKTVHFDWHGPQEVKELGKELTDLADRYVKTKKAGKIFEKKIKSLSHRTEMILNSAAEGILSINTKGEISFANPAAARMFGFKIHELISEDLHSLLHYLRKDRSQFPSEDCPFCQTLKNGPVDIRTEDVFWKKDGSMIHVHYSTSPIYNADGRTKGTVMCIQDISERIQAEEKMTQLQAQLLQSQKLEAIGTLAGGVAHDFNNLLTHITGFSDILLMEMAKNDPQRKHVKIIKNAAMRAGGLTRQLLTFSRKQSATPQFLDLNMLIQNMEKMLHRFIGEDIALVTNLGHHKIVVKVDPGLIEQILMNLVINSRDAMPDGGRMTIATKLRIISEDNLLLFPQGRTGSFACIVVTDQGLGIDDEIIDRIFDPFFTTKGVGEGTGLGLSVIYGIVKQHNGWINVVSKKKKGTIFQIFFPLCHQPESPAAPNREGKEIPAGLGKRILLLEDEPAVRQVAEIILKQSGYKVFSAATVQEGLNLFNWEKGRFDLIFSDMVLPDGNGIQFIDQILAQKPEQRLLMSSGYSDERSQWDAIKKRNLPFLQKPYTMTELQEAVYKGIGEQKSGDRSQESEM